MQAQAISASIPVEQRQWEANHLVRQAEGTPLTLYGHAHGYYLGNEVSHVSSQKRTVYRDARNSS